ncbi:MAG: molybdopterin oxidoreductase [Actinomycetota bacterium]
MQVGNYLGLLHNSEQQLANGFLAVANHHGDEPDIYETCQLLASWSQAHVQALQPFINHYSEQKSEEPERLIQSLFAEPRSGSLALLRDLHDLWLLANEVSLCWTVLLQASQALRDRELQAACQELSEQTKRQLDWLWHRIKQAAPQILVVAA